MKVEALFVALQPFASEQEELYSVEDAAHLSRMPRHIVLVCCRRGLVTPQIDAAFGMLRFTRETIRELQRLEYLRSACGVNLEGLQIIVHLMREVEQLRDQTSRD